MNMESTLNVKACENGRFDEDLPFDEVNTCRSEVNVAFDGGVITDNLGLDDGFRVGFDPDFAFAFPAAMALYIR